MNVGQQIVSVVGMNTRAMRSRAAQSLVIVVGMAAVVAVALSIFSMSAGLLQMTEKTTSPDRMAIAGLGSEVGAPPVPIQRDHLSIIADTPGLKIGSDGKPLLYGNVGGPSYPTHKKENGVDVWVGFQGVGANIMEVRPEIKIIEGRMFTAGLREIIAGKGAVERFEGIALGQELRMQDGPWTIVGIFDAAGGTSDYLLWTDADTMASAYRRNVMSPVFARLKEGTKAAQEAFKTALKANPSVQVEVDTEYEQRMKGQIGTPIKFYKTLAYFVGGIMGLGAIFAALNTMYAAVSARTMEIATLRAIGFGTTPVVISIILEALALALVGALFGAAISWLGFNGRDQNYGIMAIHQIISPSMMTAGIGLSLLVGLIGAMFPAIRAARLPVATALQVR